MVVLLGHVGQDPEMRTTAGGKRVAKLSLATNEAKDKVSWHRLTAWERTAEIVEQYVRKGSQIHVVGRIQYSQAEVQGQTRYYTDIIVDRLTLLGGKQADDDGLPF